MKTIKLLALTIFTLVLGSACSNSEMEITGTMHYIDQTGTRCWYITDTKTNFNYEVLRSENYLFREGQKIKIKAHKGTGTTFCKVGEKIEIVTLKILQN